MNGYKALYGSKSTEVYADTSYEAQQKAVAFFKAPPKKSYMVSVYLCESNVEEPCSSPPSTPVAY